MRQRTTSGRPHRLAELLRERLALILLQKCADPRLQELTLTRVEMSPDLKQAKVYYAAHVNTDATQLHQALDKALGFIKQEVAREHLLRVMPEFIFLEDTGLDEAARLERLFHEVEKSGKSGKESEN